MAVLMHEGFDTWPASSFDPSTFYGWETSTTGGFATQAGTLGGRSVAAASSQRVLTYNLGATYTTLIIGMRVRLQTVNALQTLCLLQDSAAATQCGICVTAAGKLAFFRGTTATILATGTTTLVVGAEYFIEAKILVDNSGTVELQLNGVAEIASTAGDTTNTAISSASYVQWVLGTGSPIDRLDDVHILDTSSGVANTFIGLCRTEELIVTSNDSVQWTPLSSTNASNVDDATFDDDTTYNSDNTSGHIDLFNHGSLSSTPVTIHAVTVKSRAKKDDVTSRQLRNKLKSGATTSNGASQQVQTIYMTQKDLFLLDPNAGPGAWTAANVNATKIGYERV